MAEPSVRSSARSTGTSPPRCGAVPCALCSAVSTPARHQSRGGNDERETRDLSAPPASPHKEQTEGTRPWGQLWREKMMARRQALALPLMGRPSDLDLVPFDFSLSPSHIS
ncbi:hypothetical protein CDD83_2856 [Cordyceps sp. RAO-2017]|nr:hypothetical protein CDD83_2856 [Cordyceps sp. RAO-2017]